MAQYLKGNYRLPKKMKAKTNKDQKTIEEVFEQKASTKLGGSIAFIVKSKTFVWEGDEDKKTA